MEFLTSYLFPAFEILQAIIAAVGVLIVAWGVFEAAWAFLKLRTVQHSSRLFVRASSIRERLGVHLLLALDVFIGADLIATVLHPDWGSIGVLAMIVAIRVILSFLLSYEIAEVHRIVAQDSQANADRADG